MKKNYNSISLFKVFACVLVLGVAAQAEVQWEDHFDDPVQDYLLNNVGWLYFTPDDGLVGQIVMQTDDQKAYLKSGIYSSLVGAALIETNGVAAIDPTNMDATEAEIVEQSLFIDPNHMLTFNVNFKKISMVENGAFTTGTFFICGARFQAGQGDEYPDPTVDSTYALIIAPLINLTAIMKVSGELNILNPLAWTWLTPQFTDFEYDLGVTYQVKLYMNGGDLKVKVWEGDPTDEPAEWLLETVDPDPWVAGTFHMFGLLGDPVADGDELILDDVVVSFIDTEVDSDVNTVPAEFSLADNYPNPFNPQTTIEYSLNRAGEVSVNVYSVTGRLVQTLVSGHQTAGTHSVVFDAHSLPSGIYFYTLTNGEQTITKKMLLAK